MTFSISWFCFVSQDLWHNIIDINPICQSVLFKVLSFIVQLFEQAVTWCPPHNITWLLRICNVFSNFISLLWNYAAQHNSTWLQTCWNIKRQLLWICVPGFICICENYVGPSIWVFTFSDKAQVWESVSPVFSTQPNQRCASSFVNM